MIIIAILSILLITYIHSIKDIITLLYYNDILYNIDRSTKNCSKEYYYEDKYKYSIISNILIKITQNDNESYDDFIKRKEEILIDIYSNPIARELYYFLKDKNIYDYYNGISGTLLGLFVVFTGLLLYFTFNIKEAEKYIVKYGILYICILLYIIAYSTLFGLLSDKLKNYNNSINSKEYYNTDKLRYDLEELKKIIYSHIGLILIIIILIMISYKKLYGDKNYYIAYGIFITIIIIIYILYFIYNNFIL